MNPGFVYQRPFFWYNIYSYFNISEEYAQFYGAMNTMRQGGMVTMRKDGLPYDEMGYCPPPNRYLRNIFYNFFSNNVYGKIPFIYYLQYNYIAGNCHQFQEPTLTTIQLTGLRKVMHFYT